MAAFAARTLPRVGWITEQKIRERIAGELSGIGKRTASIVGLFGAEREVEQELIRRTGDEADIRIDKPANSSADESLNTAPERYVLIPIPSLCVLNGEPDTSVTGELRPGMASSAVLRPTIATRQASVVDEAALIRAAQRGDTLRPVMFVLMRVSSCGRGW
jgi:hypothetical protein